MTATIAEAARLYAARDLSQAAKACLEIIRNEPRHFDALHLLGVICTNRGQHADGVSYLLRAEAIMPGNGRLHANLGSAYGALQRFDKAVEAYQRAMTLQHRDPDVLNNFGLALRGLGRTEEAIATFRTAIERDPANDPALYNLARAMAADGQLARAESDLRRLRDRLPPETPNDRIAEAVNELARVVLDQGRPEESSRSSEKSPRVAPTSSRRSGTKPWSCCCSGAFRKDGRPTKPAGRRPTTSRGTPIIGCSIRIARRVSAC